MRERSCWLLSVVIGFVGINGPAMGSAGLVDVWSIDSGEINPTSYYGVSVANGVVGIVSAPAPFRTAQTLINGAYETLHPGYVSCTVSTFNFLNVAFSVDGERIHSLDQVKHFRQRLDLKGAVLTSSFDYRDKASITYKLRSLRHLPYTALLEITVTAKRPISIATTSLLDLPQPLTKVDFPQPLSDIATYNRRIELKGAAGASPDRHQAPHLAVHLRGAGAKTQFGAHSVGAAQSFIFDETFAAAPQITHAPDGLAFTKQLPAGTSYRFALVGSTLTSAHVHDPLTEALHLTAFAVVHGTQRLIARHEREWADLWESNIVIDGDPEIQRDVHSMIYHLYSFIREDMAYSISPMGLSRGPTGYLGHIFWDADFWMFPALLALKPKLAKSMLDYRYDRLPAAKKRAVAHGYRGAMFPWESAATGDDDTPNSALTGELQPHISAVVAIAAWNYFRVTQDRDWLREKGYPLIRETADFWTSRVDRNGPGRYDISNVVAADEYAENVDNNAFTNAAARANLAYATAAAKVLGLTPDPDWEHVRGNIPILKFPDDVTREHATYNGEMIKQADVNLLAYPLKEVTDPQAIRRDLEYYQNRNDAALGPAMTKSIFSVLYQRLGMPQKAYQMFKDGYGPNKRPPFGTLAENASSHNPYFVTAAGGLLQAMLFGFGGLDITDQGIVQVPTKLPTAWKSVTLTGIGPNGRTYVVK